VTITTHSLVDCLAESNIAFVTCFTLCMSYLLFYLTVTVSLIYANIDRRCCTLCMLYLCYMMQGRSDGGYIGIYTLPKSVPENYFVH